MHAKDRCETRDALCWLLRYFYVKLDFVLHENQKGRNSKVKGKRNFSDMNNVKLFV